MENQIKAPLKTNTQATGSGKSTLMIILVLGIIGYLVYHYRGVIFGKFLNSSSDELELNDNTKFPIHFLAWNPHTLTIQKKLNQTLKNQGKTGFTKEDGILGKDTIRLIGLFFPEIAGQITTSKTINEEHFRTLTSI